jgi:hypothetical protein
MMARLRSFLAAPLFVLACAVLLGGACLMWLSALLDSEPLSCAAQWMEDAAARRRGGDRA